MLEPDIAPIERAGCRQPASRQSGLSLATFAGFQAGGRKGPAFVGLTCETKPQMPFGGPSPTIGIREGARNDFTHQTIETVPAGPVVYHAAPVTTARAISPDGQTWPQAD